MLRQFNPIRIMLSQFNWYVFWYVTCLLVACMAHARRKFDEALKAIPKASRENKFGMAPIALLKFRVIYALEKQMKDLTTKQRYCLRQEQSKPLMEDLTHI